MYEDNKKDRLGEIERQKQVFIDLVLQLRSTVSAADRVKIENALQEVSNSRLSPNSAPIVLRRTVLCGRWACVVVTLLSFGYVDGQTDGQTRMIQLHSAMKQSSKADYV